MPTKNPRAHQHNAHVRARARLITRVIDRAWDWKIGGMNGLTREERTVWAAAGVAAYQWPAGWGTKAAPRGFQGSTQYKDVPAHVIHNMLVASIRIERAA